MIVKDVQLHLKELVCYNEANNTKKDPTVDLFSQIEDNKGCKRIYTEVVMDNSIGQVWRCADE